MARGRSSSGGGRSSPAPAPAARSAPTQTRSYSSAPAPAAAKPAAAPAAAPSYSHPPSQPHHAPQQPPMMQQQQQGGGGLLSGLAGTVMSGMAFGTGSAIAHRAVDAVVGPREVNHVHSNGAPAAAAASSRCNDQNTKFTSCMRENQGNIASCQYLYDVLAQCQREEQQ